MATLPPPLDTLTPAECEVLDGYLERVTFPAEATIFEAGAPGDASYIIDAGEVRLEVDHPHLDTDAVLGYLGPGTILGELSLLDGMPRSAGAIADEETTARRLTRDHIEQLLADHPAIGLSVLRALGQDAARKLRQANTLLVEHLADDTVDPEVEDMVARAKAAQREIETWSEERIDALLADIAETVAGQAEALAKAIVEETHIGNVADKTLKNLLASVGVYQSLAGKPGRGPLGPADQRNIVDIASPAGVIVGLVPQTNPVATAVFKTLVGIKARNALILSAHRSALGVMNTTGELMREVIVRHGAPADVVQWIRARTNRRKTARFMAHPDVGLVLATGGPGMVKAAYSSGTPAIGVGQGNTPTWVAPDADVAQTAAAIVASKSFDNGLICGSEHNLVVDRTVRDALIAALEANGAAVLDADEAALFKSKVFTEDGRSLQPLVIGQAGQLIADVVGLRRDHAIKVIVVPDEPDFSSPLTGEKLTPILSLFTVDSDDEAIDLSCRLLEHMGNGHTAIVHSADQGRIERFGMAVTASRILVNSPGAQGVSGVTSGLVPSFTLGCGTFGRNSTTDNVTYTHLRNVKHLAYGTQPEVPAGPAPAAVPAS